MRIMLIILVLIFIFVIAGAADALTGTPRIVDGDTIWIGESKIRLHGTDAPEARQQCRQSDGTAHTATGFHKRPTRPRRLTISPL
jgi:endonuclease YncB( thermonuclease family)